MVLRALNRLFESAPYPRSLQSDAGMEFLNASVRDYLQSKNIKHFITSSDTKCSIVERFNRTLKGRMFKFFTANNTFRYLDVLQNLVDAYNNRIHRSIGIAPNKITSKNEQKVWDYQYKSYLRKYRSAKFKFKVGDTVRISKLHQQFRKGYLPTYNDEYFTIHTRLATSPPTYKLLDQSGNVLVGVFYHPELQRVVPVEGSYTVLRRRKRRGIPESLVHFTGRPIEQQEWIANRELLTRA